MPFKAGWKKTQTNMKKTQRNINTGFKLTEANKHTE